MADDIQQVRDLVIQAMRLSRQGSYSRMAPARECLPYLAAALAQLEAMTNARPDCAEPWRLLALVHEVRLDYTNAIRALEKHISAKGAASREDLKRMAALRRYASEWCALDLTPEALARLGEYLRTALASNTDSEDRFAETRSWLREQNHRSPESVIEAFRSRGVFDDLGVLNNIVHG